jgi:hypothetical protein
MDRLTDEQLADLQKNDDLLYIEEVQYLRLKKETYFSLIAEVRESRKLIAEYEEEEEDRQLLSRAMSE